MTRYKAATFLSVLLSLSHILLYHTTAHAHRQPTGTVTLERTRFEQREERKLGKATTSGFAECIALTEGTKNGRQLLQRDNEKCEELREKFYNASSGTWKVNDTVQSDEDFAVLVDCTRDDDIVELRLTTAFMPLEDTVVIKRSITITTRPDENPKLNGTVTPLVPKAEFTCPDRDRGVFEIKAPNVTLANLVIRDCRQTKKSKSPVSVEGVGNVTLMHVEFKNNEHHASGNPSTLFFAKTPKSSLTMMGVVFTNNTGGPSVVKFPQTVEMENVTAQGNSGKSAVFKLPRESSTSVYRLKAIDNDVTVMSMRNGHLSMSESNFTGNKNSEGVGGALSITDGSTVSISDCRFERNKANDGGALSVTNSSITIVDTVFKKQNVSYDGGACFFRDARANVTDCTFEENYSDNDGGAIRSEGGRLLCLRTEFLRNSARNTGGCFKLDRSETTLRESNFIHNKAIFGAVFRSENSVQTTVSKCKIKHNEAENTGGACAFDADIFAIKDSVLKNNSAAYGAAVFAQKSKPGSEIVDTVFEENHAKLLGGVGLLDFGNLTLRSVTFVKNRAYLGGGFYFVHMSVNGSELVFIENSASEGGAFASVESNIDIRSLPLSATRTTSFGIRAEGNVARNGGGALQLDNTTIAIRDGEFANCSGVEGGAIRVLGGKRRVRIMDSKFWGNVAEESGGSIYARSEKGRSVYLRLDNVSFNNSSSAQAGGGCYLSSVDATIKNCRFQECSSMYGGALLLRKGSTTEHLVKIINTTIHNNSAIDSGGGIYVSTELSLFLESTVITDNTAADRNGGGITADNARISLTNVTIGRNEAQKGGGIAAMNEAVLHIRKTNVTRNSARHGGGVFIENIKNATIVDTHLGKNRADGKGGGMLLEDSLCEASRVRFTENSARDGGGLAIDQTSRALCSECRFELNKARANGGGIIAKAEAKSEKISAQLDRCKFIGNKATFGGGIYYLKSMGLEDRDVVREQNATIEGIVLINTLFSDNIAEKNGSAVHTNRKSFVSVFCPKSATLTSLNATLTPEDIRSLRKGGRDEKTCRRKAILDNNKASFTTYAREIRLDGYGLTHLGFNEYRLSEIVSGSVLSPIIVTPQDDYGQFPALSLNGDLKPRLTGDLVGGIFAASLNENGSYSFSGIRTNVMKPEKYRLTVSFSNADELVNLTILVKARECHVGEMQRQDGVYCEDCSSTSYTFSPEESTCSPCPTNANCTGSFIFPQKGYWLNSPCHNRTVECLNPEACDGLTTEEITSASEIHSDKLYRFTEGLEKTCPVTETDQMKFRELQCREGYEGVLCGQCSEGHGLTSVYTCVDCLPEPALILLLILAAGWVYLVAGITLHGSRIKSRELLKDLISQQSIQESSRMIRRSSRMWTVSKRSRRTRSESGSQPSGSDSTSAEHAANVDWGADVQKEREALLAKWQMCEIIKIVVNFLQATSVAVLINVEWKQYILGLFRGSDLASGATVETVSNAIHCLSPDSISHPSVTSTLTVLFGPFLIALTFAILFFAIAIGGQINKTTAMKQFFLCFFAILYFNYSNITRQSLNVFLCIGIPGDDYTDTDSVRYVWAQDTSLECKDGQHGALIAVTSIFVAAVSFGFPIACSFVHYAYKRLDLDSSGTLYDIMGFMFRAYDYSHSYWESLIMLRKACLSLVTVFSYRLGGTTQGLMASAMLITCLFLHTMCRPFRDEFRDLNKYESYSLIVSCMTYLLAGFFVDGRASEGVKLLLSACLMAMILGFILLMIYVLMKSIFWFIEADLQTVNIESSDASPVALVLLWVAYRTGYKKAPPTEKEAECEMSTVA